MNNNYCVECYSGYLPLGGKCQAQNPLCKTANAKTGVCESCWMGYTLFSGNCQLGQPTVGGKVENDIYCVKIQGDLCIECSNGYYVGTTGKCEALDPLCKSHDLKTGACLTCYGGFILTGPKCVQLVVAQIPNCSNVTPAGMCTSCIEGYFLSGNTCKPVPITCAAYNRADGVCTKCIAGHFLQDNICIYPAIFDPNCIYYESAYCSKCATGYKV